MTGTEMSRGSSAGGTLDEFDLDVRLSEAFADGGGSGRQDGGEGAWGASFPSITCSPCSAFSRCFCR